MRVLRAGMVLCAGLLVAQPGRADLSQAPALPPPLVDASAPGRPACPPDEPAPGDGAAYPPAAAKPGAPAVPQIGGVPRGAAIPGFPLLCLKPGKKLEKGALIRAVPGLEAAMKSLQCGNAAQAKATLADTCRQIDECKNKLKLKPGKQCKATRKALDVAATSPGAMAPAVSAALKQSSPILLDLNGNGQADVTTPDYSGDHGAFVAKGAVWFDVAGNGERRRTEWVKPGQDGLLAMDTNGNGVVDSAAELFGDVDGFVDGYAKLAMLDTNHDGKLTGAELSNLSVWVDDGDGVCAPSEMKSLAELGITSIDVTHHDFAASFVRNGKTFASWDWFPRAE